MLELSSEEEVSVLSEDEEVSLLEDRVPSQAERTRAANESMRVRVIFFIIVLSFLFQEFFLNKTVYHKIPKKKDAWQDLRHLSMNKSSEQNDISLHLINFQGCPAFRHGSDRKTEIETGAVVESIVGKDIVTKRIAFDKESFVGGFSAMLKRVFPVAFQ